jgi:outer membrane protein assembly factor BamB
VSRNQCSAAVSRNWLALTVGVMICSMAFVCQAVRGEQEAQTQLSSAIEKTLRWLPANTETIVVAQLFKIQASRPAMQSDKPVWSQIQDLSLCGIAELEESAGLDQLIGKKVALAINGGRSFEVVSAFGSLRYQGCGIIRLAEPLPDGGRKLTDALRKASKAVRTIVGTEVFVFPDLTAMESTFKPKKWQGQFIALPAPDTLLSASSDAFLREVLERSKAAPTDRALAASLPEWERIDTAAPVWALRHIPSKLSGQLASGLTWCLKPQGRKVFEVTYLPIKDKNPLPLAKIWSEPGLGARPSINQKPDGTVVVTVDLEKEKQQMWYSFTIYWSLGDIGQPMNSLSPAEISALFDDNESDDDVKDAPNPEETKLPPDCLEEVWSTQGEAYSGVGVEADGKTIVGVNWTTADLFDKSGRKTRSFKLPIRGGMLRCARLTAKDSRELLLFDVWGAELTAVGSNGVKLWTQPLGIDDVWAADLDGDRKDEVIVGYNGNVGLHVFGGDGKLRWKDTSIGNVWHVTAGDIDGDGKLEVLTTSSAGKVHVFDADGQKLATFDPGTNANMVRVFRLPGEPADNILVVGADSRDAQMVALNAKGDRLWRTDLPRGVNTCGSLAVARGSKWAAAGSMGSVVWLTDVSTGKILGARPRLGRPEVAWINDENEAPLLLVASTSGLAAFRVKGR